MRQVTSTPPPFKGVGVHSTTGGGVLLSGLCLGLLLLCSCASNNSNNIAGIANVELGLGYLEAGNMVRAKSALQHALQLAPNIEETHTAMAYLLQQVGEINLADKEYQQAIKFSKQPTASYNNYGVFLCKQRKFVAADIMFNKALQDKYYPNIANVYNNAASCARENKQSAQAKQYAEAASRHSL
ncbi:MAG: hypothetical protein COC15_04465 [Legionellales bacterium]|nr:MAG: hypothetical protein COC15_04465 [Legionellales bacterium]